jgi:monoamine oxidase
VADFARRSRQPANVRKWALAFLEGFNAGPADRLGTKAIQRDMEAAERIEGDRTFRILNGYDSLVHAFQARDESIRLSTVVTKITWGAGRAMVHAKHSIDGSPFKVTCRCVIVTVSLGVLSVVSPAVGAITFEPEIPRVSEAVANLEFGDVYRATFRFAERFWEDNDELAKAGFWISQEKVFPTWWTSYPVIAPILTGWSAGPAAESLRGASRETIIAAALRSLSKILHRRIPPPQAVHFEDWHANPFVRGAYSYASVDSIPQRQALAKPVAGTLFFAGEATNTEGHAATVHGAIASGVRAAQQVERSLRKTAR